MLLTLLIAVLGFVAIAGVGLALAGGGVTPGGRLLFQRRGLHRRVVRDRDDRTLGKGNSGNDGND